MWAISDVRPAFYEREGGGALRNVDSVGTQPSIGPRTGGDGEDVGEGRHRAPGGGHHLGQDIFETVARDELGHRVVQLFESGLGRLSRELGP